MQDLIIGFTYFFSCGDKGMRLELVGKYRYHAVFQCEAGYKVSYTYWELRQS